MHPIVETWEINHRLNEYLLSSIKEEHFSDVGATKGRSVGKQFAHIHSVRLMWIEVAAPELMKGLQKFGKDDEVGVLALKANDHMPDKKILYGLWEWGVR